MTTFWENVGIEPLTAHPPASLLFAAYQDHTDPCLLPGLVLNPKGRYNNNETQLEVKHRSGKRKKSKEREKTVVMNSPKILRCDLLLKINRLCTTIQ